MTTAIEKPTGIKGWGVANDQLTMTQRWVSLVSMMITGVAVVFIVMKWNPILAIVGAEYGMDMSSIGNISGLALFMGCIVCFPAVWIMRNIGVKFTLALSIVITLAGSIMSLCVDTAGLFLAARVIEGAGMGMLAAAGPNIIPRLIPLQKMGLAMGVWSQWTVTGLLAAIFVGSRLYASTGDTATVTYLGIGLLVAALIVHCVAFRLCAVDENVLNAQAAQAQQKTAISRNYVRAGIICASASSATAGSSASARDSTPPSCSPSAWVSSSPTTPPPSRRSSWFSWASAWASSSRRCRCARFAPRAA